MSSIKWDQNDLDSMKLCVWREARGEGDEGMAAVAHVIFNRAKAWYSAVPEPIHHVVYAKNQFTSMTVPTDPEFRLFPQAGDVQYAYCDGLCTSILNGTDEIDPTHGALYYANIADSTSGWFFDNIVNNPNHPLLATIGRQNFYG